MDNLDALVSAHVKSGWKHVHTVPVHPVHQLPAPGARNPYYAFNTGRHITVWDPKVTSDPQVVENQFHEFSLHVDDVWALSCSPDNQFIASGSYDGTVSIVCTADYEPYAFFLALAAGTIQSIEYSHDGMLLAVGGDGGSAKVFDDKSLATRPCDKTVEFGAYRTFNSTEGCCVYVVAFSPALLPNGHRMLATAASDLTIRIFDVEGGTELHRFDKAHASNVYGLSFAMGGTILVSASIDGTSSVFDASDFSAANHKSVRTVQRHAHEVWRVNTYPSQTMVVTAARDGTCKLWSLDGEAERCYTLHDCRLHDTTTLVMVTGIAISPCGDRVAVASEDRTIFVYSVNRLWQIQAIFLSNCALSVAFTPCGRKLIVGFRGGKVRVYRINDKRIVTVLSETCSHIKLPNGMYAVNDGSALHVYDPQGSAAEPKRASSSDSKGQSVSPLRTPKRSSSVHSVGDATEPCPSIPAVGRRRWADVSLQTDGVPPNVVAMKMRKCSHARDLSSQLISELLTQLASVDASMFKQSFSLLADLQSSVLSTRLELLVSTLQLAESFLRFRACPPEPEGHMPPPVDVSSAIRCCSAMAALIRKRKLLTVETLKSGSGDTSLAAIATERDGAMYDLILSLRDFALELQKKDQLVLVAPSSKSQALVELQHSLKKCSDLISPSEEDASADALLSEQRLMFVFGTELLPTCMDLCRADLPFRQFIVDSRRILSELPHFVRSLVHCARAAMSAQIATMSLHSDELAVCVLAKRVDNLLLSLQQEHALMPTLRAVADQLKELDNQVQDAERKRDEIDRDMKRRKREKRPLDSLEQDHREAEQYVAQCKRRRLECFPRSSLDRALELYPEDRTELLHIFPEDEVEHVAEFRPIDVLHSAEGVCVYIKLRGSRKVAVKQIVDAEPSLRDVVYSWPSSHARLLPVDIEEIESNLYLIMDVLQDIKRFLSGANDVRDPEDFHIFCRQVLECVAAMHTEGLCASGAYDISNFLFDVSDGCIRMSPPRSVRRIERCLPEDIRRDRDAALDVVASITELLPMEDLLSLRGTELTIHEILLHPCFAHGSAVPDRLSSVLFSLAAARSSSTTNRSLDAPVHVAIRSDTTTLADLSSALANCGSDAVLRPWLFDYSNGTSVHFVAAAPSLWRATHDVFAELDGHPPTRNCACSNRLHLLKPTTTVSDGELCKTYKALGYLIAKSVFEGVAVPLPFCSIIFLSFAGKQFLGSFFDNPAHTRHAISCVMDYHPTLGDALLFVNAKSIPSNSDPLVLVDEMNRQTEITASNKERALLSHCRNLLLDSKTPFMDALSQGIRSIRFLDDAMHLLSLPDIASLICKTYDVDCYRHSLANSFATSPEMPEQTASWLKEIVYKRFPSRLVRSLLYATTGSLTLITDVNSQRPVTVARCDAPLPFLSNCDSSLHRVCLPAPSSLPDLQLTLQMITQPICADDSAAVAILNGAHTLHPSVLLATWQRCVCGHVSRILPAIRTPNIPVPSCAICMPSTVADAMQN